MRSKMSRADRAKQFMPFAALKGYEEAIAELNLAHEPRITLGEDAAQELDSCLHNLYPGVHAAIRYYNGRIYDTAVGRIQEIDEVNRQLLLSGIRICFGDIAALEIVSDV